ncbi:uncharacterized protein [Spinacia oleracea]|uniref:RNase H type-1 domain-containing protein n=1 Tax=Spinacia oleracea TaxID=3562 RepID=A0A9R0J0L4_SPIOL|nr:uncharacterized protein LOC110798256 [Spinacia oleracea]
MVLLAKMTKIPWIRMTKMLKVLIERGAEKNLISSEIVDRGEPSQHTDADIKDGVCGLSMVVRDGVGNVLMSVAVPKLANKQTDMAELAQALKFGMEYAFDEGFRSIEVESDCLK